MFSEAVQDFKKRIVYKNYFVMSFPSEERVLFFLCVKYKGSPCQSYTATISAPNVALQGIKIKLLDNCNRNTEIITAHLYQELSVDKSLSLSEGGMTNMDAKKPRNCSLTSFPILKARKKQNINPGKVESKPLVQAQKSPSKIKNLRMTRSLPKNPNTSITSLPFVDTKGKKNMVNFPHISNKILLKAPLLYQENQSHSQMPASELQASEMLFHSSIKTEDPKPEEKPPRKHKVPLTAAVGWNSFSKILLLYLCTLGIENINAIYLQLEAIPSMMNIIKFYHRWEPSLRMTPDQALKHAWIHEPRNLKPRSRPQTLRKASLCLPSEAPKAKVRGHHHLDIKGTAPQIAKETIDKIKGGTTKQVQNSGDQQGSLQHAAEVVQLPQLIEASGKPEAAVGPEGSETSPEKQSKNSSPKNMNILPPII
ncbi:uncharacterized protein LOC102742853 [Leptonychotes weddellii]|uniref:Uncharacterized protein LOC102742853 n=1 Tax=Leptonychotes weddellii TaxID=9713 RepID=A0A7F8Q798_LEPWE|nr:uncharacterized protein LOC102742853 [Leptonychotes weddellii]